MTTTSSPATAIDVFDLLLDGEVTGPGTVEDGAQTLAAAEAQEDSIRLTNAVIAGEACSVCGGHNTPGLYATGGCDDLECDSHLD